MFPGAGHMYLGLQRRGLQLMDLLTIYLFTRLIKTFCVLFLVPIICSIAF